MKFAVIQTGGKQYKVSESQVLVIEKIDKKVGSPIVFDKVLLYFDGKKTEIGKPYLRDKKVSAKVLEQLKGKKIYIIKFKPKVRYKRKKGHRQLFTKVKIGKIG